MTMTFIKFDNEIISNLTSIFNHKKKKLLKKIPCFCYCYCCEKKNQLVKTHPLCRLFNTIRKRSNGEPNVCILLINNKNNNNHNIKY